MDNTQGATVISGSAVGKAAADTAAKKELQANNQQEPSELKIAADVDTPVSTEEAQRKTAVWIEILYASLFLLVGLILGVWAIVLYADPNGLEGMSYDNLGNNSLFAMGIVGLGLIVWGICAVAVAAGMQIKNKTTHKVSNALGIMNWFTLNPASWSLIRQSNGYVSKKQKAKMAKKAAEANSQDSLDEAADVQQEQQAQATEIN